MAHAQESDAADQLTDQLNLKNRRQIRYPSMDIFLPPFPGRFMEFPKIPYRSRIYSRLSFCLI